MTSDSDLASRLQQSAPPGCLISQFATLSRETIELLHGHRAVVAVDCRGLGNDEARAALNRANNIVGHTARVTAIGDLKDKVAVETLMAAHGIASDVVLVGIDNLCLTLATIANDPFASNASALSFASLSERVFPEGRDWLFAVTADLRAVSSVKQLASHFGVSARTLEREAVRRSLPAPTTLIELAQASFALLCCVPRGPDEREIARAIGYSDERALNALMDRRFKLDLATGRKLVCQVGARRCSISA